MSNVNEDTYEAALHRIHSVFLDSREVIAAFMSYARGGEAAPPALIDEANRVLGELITYGKGISSHNLPPR